jgi:arginase
MAVVVLDAPSNLGLRPPMAGTVPGCYKAPWALRDKGLLDRLGATDAGCVVPPRYDRGSWQSGDGVFNAAQIADYSLRLAARIDHLLSTEDFPVVLGGDCSILLGAGIAMRRRHERAGLVFVDGHSDFRHPGNSTNIGAAAGEDLALVTGRGQADLTGLAGEGAMFADADVVSLGVREGDDESAAEFAEARIAYRTAAQIRADSAVTSGAWARDRVGGIGAYWVHVDVDVLDESVMSAVDSPSPGGLAPQELADLLWVVLAAPQCAGLEVTVFDPDLDPSGVQAQMLVDVLVSALAARR